MRKKMIGLIETGCALLFGLSMCLAVHAAEIPAAKTGITNEILDTFSQLTKIPRPSHHEAQISEYLKNWATEHQFKVTQDALMNLIIDVPATSGMEKKPLVILQGHMDMVFAQKDGAELDPLTTPIQMVVDGEYVRSDGKTSLGADDGIGLSIMMNIAEGKMAHGPLRLIITTDEEDTESGAHGIAPSYFENVPYCINLDYEQEGSMCVSSASANALTYTKQPLMQPAANDTALYFAFQNLDGGHSGVQIHEGHLNPLIAVGRILKTLKDAGFSYEIASIQGGTVANAIPTGAKVVLYCKKGDVKRVTKLIKQEGKALLAAHAASDPFGEITVRKAKKKEARGSVLSIEDQEAVIGFLTDLTDGVYTMSPDMEGLVECSTNLGIFNASDAGVNAVALVRSSSLEKGKELCDKQIEVGRTHGFAIASDPNGVAWAYEPDSKLRLIANESYEALFAKKLKNEAIHATLECGVFSAYNEKMNIVSLGATIIAPHGVNERVEIASIEKVWLLLERMMSML